MSETRTGRPPLYSEEQVMKGIDRVEQDGGKPTGETVKKAMCDHQGVSRGISALSLSGEVARLLEERARARRELLVAALPPETMAAAKVIGANFENAMLGHMAEEYERLRSAAGTKILELREDLNSQRAQIRELLSRGDEKERTIADLEGTREELQARLAAVNTENASLKGRVMNLEKEENFREQMLELMRETLAQHPPPVA